MSTPLIQDPLLIQEVNRIFKTKYGELSSSTTEENLIPLDLDDPRTANFDDQKIDSFQEQRAKIRQMP